MLHVGLNVDSPITIEDKELEQRFCIVSLSQDMFMCYRRSS